MQNPAPVQLPVHNPLFHRRRCSFLLLHEIVLHGKYFQPLLDAQLPLGEAASTTAEAADALAQLGAEAINLRDADLILGDESKDYLAHDAEDLLSLSNLLAYAIVHRTLREVLRDCGEILLVPICVNGKPALLCGEAQPRGEHSMEGIAGLVIPFSDGKADEELGMPFVAEVGIRIADLPALELGR